MAIHLQAEPRPDDPRALVARCVREVGLEITDPFIVIEREPQQFMQCLHQHTRWRLERRDGGPDAHFLAFVAGTERMMLEDGEVEAALVAYLERNDEPEWIDWRPIEV